MLSVAITVRTLTAILSATAKRTTWVRVNCFVRAVGTDCTVVLLLAAGSPCRMILTRAGTIRRPSGSRCYGVGVRSTADMVRYAHAPLSRRRLDPRHEVRPG